VAKNRILILLWFSILILFFYGCKKNQETPKENIKVVAVMSLSGEAKASGQSSKNSLELLSKEFSKKGIEITYLDDESNKEKAESSLKALIAKEKIKAIILCNQGTSAEVVAKIATENQIVVINATATDVTVSNIGKDFLYSLCYSNEFEGNALAQFTYEKLKLSKVAILYNEEELYSKNLADFYKGSFEKSGGQVTVISGYKNNISDYSEVLQKIKNIKPDVLFIPDYYYKVYNIGRQARNIGINTILLGGDGWDNSELLTKEEFQGSYFLSQFIASDSIPGTIEFKKQYEDKFKVLPDARAALTYDAGTLILAIFENYSNSDNLLKLNETLEKITMDGVSGNISFSQDKRAKKSSYIVEIKNKSLEIISKVLP